MHSRPTQTRQLLQNQLLKPRLQQPRHDTTSPTRTRPDNNNGSNSSLVLPEYSSFREFLPSSSVREPHND